jgi:hypothetical protein
MENNQIKKEIDEEVDAFEKALIERDRLQIFQTTFTPPQETTAKGALGLDPKATVKGSDFDIDKALRYNEGKLQWSLVDFDSLEGLVRVLEAGAKKYSKNNWRKGMPVTQVSESLMRHLFAFLGGENVDPESGCRHISHVMCNAMFLEYILREKPHFDDRENSVDF